MPGRTQNYMATSATVYIVSEDAAAGDCVRALVQADGLNAECYPSAEAFLACCDAARPGCVVLDVEKSGMDEVEFLRQSTEKDIRAPVIALSATSDASRVVEVMKAGVTDFMEKPLNLEDLLERIRHAVGRDLEVRRRKSERQEAISRWVALTPRERRVVELVVAGLTNREIAAELGVTTKTVEVHRSNVMRKMKAENLVDLVRMAVRAGITAD
jgi:two-component system response regulator FixJ